MWGFTLNIFYFSFPHSTFSQLSVFILHPKVVGDHETHAGVDPLELLPGLLESKGPAKENNC